MTEHFEQPASPEDKGDSTVPHVQEVTIDIPPLYPGVGRVMDTLRRITNEHGHDLRYTESGEPILTPELVNAWGKEVGFSKPRRGTLHNEDTYLYFKRCNFVKEERDVDATLATARELTRRGALHPESQWGVFNSRGGYQLFVVSPALEAWSRDAEIAGEYDDRAERPQRDNSHLLEWFQRVDPQFVPGQPIPEDSLLYHLNWHEASYADNWGWDATGTLFPVDVETVRPESPGYKDREPWKPRSNGEPWEDDLDMV